MELGVLLHYHDHHEHYHQHHHNYVNNDQHNDHDDGRNHPVSVPRHWLYGREYRECVPGSSRRNQPGDNVTYGPWKNYAGLPLKTKCETCPCGCAWGSCGSWPPASWPCGSLTEQYSLSFNWRVVEWWPFCVEGEIYCDTTTAVSVTLTAIGTAYTWTADASAEIYGACTEEPGAITLDRDTTLGKWRITVSPGGVFTPIITRMSSCDLPTGTYPNADDSCYAGRWNLYISDVVVS